MADPTYRSPVNFSLKSLAIGIACLIVAHLALAGLQSLTTLPFSVFVQQSLATVVGILAWFYVGAKMGA